MKRPCYAIQLKENGDIYAGGDYDFPKLFPSRAEALRYQRVLGDEWKVVPMTLTLDEVLNKRQKAVMGKQ